MASSPDSGYEVKTETSGGRVSGGDGGGLGISEAAKSRRVRTGCLTCRERHLKCDEGTPDCLNCRKSSRECKRGIRLNFIDLKCEAPPYIPHVEGWFVDFADESRDIAREYKGGIERYPPVSSEEQVTPSPSEGKPEPLLHRQILSVGTAPPQALRAERSLPILPTPQPMYHSDRNSLRRDPFLDGLLSRKPSTPSFISPLNTSRSGTYGSPTVDPFRQIKHESTQSPQRENKDSDASTAGSVAGMAGNGPPSTFRAPHPGAHGNPIIGSPAIDMMTPHSDRSGEREYLSSPEELHFMQIFIGEVGVWMDSLDRDKHFSRIVPYRALKCPMLLNALLACGVQHVTLTKHYNNEKGLFYYDTATTQLLRCLQNPDRTTEECAECAATAVLLNVYEIMSEKPTEKMSHIAGARALIRECGWNATSTGLGAACFWLNVGMELLSCLVFNWQVAWDPNDWGVNMDFNTETELGCEEVWVHRIFVIVAKICNFRANIPKFQEASPHNEQIQRQARYAEWQALKNLCDSWNNACPRSMHPFAYLYPDQSSQSPKEGVSNTDSQSLFPNIWLIKRSAVVGRLYYHTAQCLLAQINPILSKDSDEARAVQLHHAHQVCGIVAHTKDRGIASVAIRSLAIVAQVLSSHAEREEVVRIFENIDKEAGWVLENIILGLKVAWGWEKPELMEWPDQSCVPSRRQQTSTPPGQMMPGLREAQATAPRPAGIMARSMSVNPLSFADFSLPNHPYQNWYEPPTGRNREFEGG